MSYLLSGMELCGDAGRFRRLWGQCPIKDAATDPIAVHRELIKRYSEPHRRYHACAHINYCLAQLDAVPHDTDERAAIEMALWFHDAIYDPQAQDNERQSAELFMTLAGDRAEAHFSRRVYDAIMTTTHQHPPGSPLEAWVVDIDLSSFGLPEADFDLNSQYIREEYAHLPDANFYPPHARFLQALLERPRIFFTDFFHDRYEGISRANIHRLLEKLLQKGYRPGRGQNPV